MDSAKPPVASNLPQEETNLLSRKFILTVLGVVIFGVFTALGKMDVETYMYFFGALTASYFGVNFIQKKLI